MTMDALASMGRVLLQHILPSISPDFSLQGGLRP